MKLLMYILYTCCSYFLKCDGYFKLKALFCLAYFINYMLAASCIDSAYLVHKGNLKPIIFVLVTST